jgi:hypothetical protein
LFFDYPLPGIREIENIYRTRQTKTELGLELKIFERKFPGIVLDSNHYYGSTSS